MKSKLFVPDRIFERFCDITPEFLLSENIKYVLSDIDNTLVTYEEPVPSEGVVKWLSELEGAGIKVAFISNNSKKRVERFNEKLGFHTLANSNKPSRKAVYKLSEKLGAKKEETCIIGDQIFTDVLCAKRAGIKAFYVRSIGKQKDPFGVMKKVFEKFFIKEYYKTVGKK